MIIYTASGLIKSIRFITLFISNHQVEVENIVNKLGTF